MAFSFDLGLAISAERYGAISAGPEQQHLKGYHNSTYGYKSSCCGNGIGIVVEHLKELEHTDIYPINPE